MTALPSVLIDRPAPTSVTATAGNPLAADLDFILEHTQPVWDELRGQRLFITGGTGFFGCWLLESLTWACDRLKLGAEAVVLSRRPDAFRRKAPHLANHPSISLLQGDVRSFDFPEGSFSHVIHAATEASVSLNDDDPLLMIDSIVNGTRRVLEFALECHAGKFLFTSSGAVYGHQPSTMTHVGEDHRGAPDTMDPRSAYGEGKRLAEVLCAVYAKKHGLDIKVARCFAFVGPYLPLDTHFAIGNFVLDAIEHRPILVKGDGSPYRSYLYAADLAVWLWQILCRGESCRPYNVGSEQDLPIAEVARTVAHVSGTDEVKIVGLRSPSEPVRRYVPSTRVARQRLNLRTWTPLHEAVRRTMKSYLASREREFHANT